MKWGKQRLFNHRTHILKKMLFDVFVPVQELDLYRGILIHEILTKKK